MNTTVDPSPLRVGDQDLNAFVDGVLDDGRRVDLLKHLATHPLDAEKANAYFRQKVALEELRDALSEDDDSDFLPDLQRRIDNALTRQRLFVGMRRCAAGLAVLAPLAAISWWTTARHEPPSVAAVSNLPEPATGPSFPFGGKLVPAELRAAEEGAASLGRLARYLNDRSLHVPDLATLGLELVGGDAIRGVDLPAARLTYMDERGNRLLVYVGIVEDDVQQAVTLVPEGHISLHWRNGPLVFAVVGPAGTPKLLEVMRSVSRGMTLMADAPAETRPQNADETLAHGAGEVQPVAMPERNGLDSGPAPKLLPSDLKGKAGDPELTPVGLETQPKV